ncbi:MAG: sigma-70 family RNA polymerase sigma factor [Myxococcales bacterium]|nr:sigma-70 family RNA polymerase sigma factor [Myxococcales bacterium]
MIGPGDARLRERPASRLERLAASPAGSRYRGPVDDDRSLLEAWREGDEDAGVRLFERHYDRVARFFRNKAGESGPDLVQRTFLRCVETRERMREQTSFRCYLFGVARNVLFEHYREKRRDGDRLDFGAVSVQDFGPTPSTIISQQEQGRILVQALRQIPVEHQVILELYYWESMRARDIAEVLDIPEGTARTRIRRAKQLLERELEALASTPVVYRSTISDLEGWAGRIRKGF